MLEAVEAVVMDVVVAEVRILLVLDVVVVVVAVEVDEVLAAVAPAVVLPFSA